MCAGAANFRIDVSDSREHSARAYLPSYRFGRRRSLERRARARNTPSAGLAFSSGVDRTTRALLLRQLYLSHMEGQAVCDEALLAAEQMIEADIMPDVALQQDAARRRASAWASASARSTICGWPVVSPPARRAFHLWTLGSVLYLMGQHREVAWRAVARVALGHDREAALPRASRARAPRRR